MTGELASSGEESHSSVERMADSLAMELKQKGIKSDSADAVRYVGFDDPNEVAKSLEDRHGLLNMLPFGWTLALSNRLYSQQANSPTRVSRALILLPDGRLANIASFIYEGGRKPAALSLLNAQNLRLFEGYRVIFQEDDIVTAIESMIERRELQGGETDTYFLAGRRN